MRAARAAIAFFALASVGIAAAQVSMVTLTTPTSAQAAPSADGFIQRWLLLEPIPASGLTEGVVRATVQKQLLPDGLEAVPHDGDKVVVGSAELAGTPWTPATTT